MKTNQDVLSILDFSSKDIRELLAIAKVLKHMEMWGQSPKPLLDKTGILIFKKPSLRTRASFAIGLMQLGANAITFHDFEIQIGKRETPEDAAQVLSRYGDVIIMRTYSQKEIEDIAKSATVPVINALTDLLHPCQVLSDAFTILEAKGKLEGIKVAYLGDGNNVAHSLLNLSSRVPIDLRIAYPVGYAPIDGIVEFAKKAGVSKITLTNDPIEAVNDADVIYTDVWASMGKKEELAERKLQMQPFQINSSLVKYAAPDYVFMHCLPAERSNEVTSDIIDSKHSIVFDQAENRLHMQKAILCYIFQANIEVE